MPEVSIDGCWCCRCLQGFEDYARNTLLQSFSIPPAGIAALQAAQAAMPPPVVRQNSSGSGGASDDQRVRAEVLAKF